MKTHLHPLKMTANQFFAPISVDSSTIPDATTHSNTLSFSNHINEYIEMLLQTQTLRCYRIRKRNNSKCEKIMF